MSRGGPAPLGRPRGCPSPRNTSHYAGRMRKTTGTVLAVLLDLCAVTLFVVIGRAGHGEGETATGLAGTAWPFLPGWPIGWVVTRGWRRPAALVSTGVGIWLSTVVAGMV